MAFDINNDKFILNTEHEFILSNAKNVNKLNEFFSILCLYMKLKYLVSNHKTIKLIEINDMGMLHMSEQP